MATILPFRAVLPAPGMASGVASRSYESYSKEEMTRLMKENTRSFLHIINPGFPYSGTITREARLKMARQKFEEFIRIGILVRQPTNCLYLYEQSGAEGKYRGLFCATSTADYRDNVIKRHEATLARRELLFARYLQTVRFNAEPVLIMYPDDREAARIFGEICRQKAEYDFQTPDGKFHRLWIISEEATIDRLQQIFAAIGPLYIADGHHRTASSNLMAETAKAANPGHTGNEAYNYFMSFLLPESELKIFSYTRLVRDLRGCPAAEMLSRLNVEFEIDYLEVSTRQPIGQHSFYMYLDHNFYLLRLRREFRNFDTPLSSLDSQILYSKILKPLLGINDLRKDKRLAYGFGGSSLAAIKELVDQEEYAVGFAMAPASVNQIKAIADAGQLMPPKTTYIEPKLRSGLIVYEF